MSIYNDKKRKYDLSFDDKSESTIESPIDDLDLSFDDIFNDVYINIFEYTKQKCKKCIEDKLIYENEFGCLDCDEINILSQLKMCSRCKKIMSSDYKFKKCGECLEKERTQRRKYPVKKCDECDGPVKSNSHNTKCEKCISNKKYNKCTKCHIVLDNEYNLKICISCRNKRKHSNTTLQINKKCITCKNKLPDTYKYKNCSNCLKKKNKSRDFYVKNKKCIKCISDLPESYKFTMCSICSYNKRKKYTQKKQLLKS